MHQITRIWIVHIKQQCKHPIFPTEEVCTALNTSRGFCAPPGICFLVTSLTISHHSFLFRKSLGAEQAISKYWTNEDQHFQRSSLMKHDDVIKWIHFLRYWTFVRGILRSPVDSPHKSQWRGAYMLYSIDALTKSWVNNPDAGVLRRHSAHYDVTVMRLVWSQLSCAQAETIQLSRCEQIL